MLYQFILYSRSRVKDYRWMLLPSNIRKTTLAHLNSLYNIYDDQKRRSFYQNANIAPVFCVDFGKNNLLFQMGLTGHQDNYSRPIFGLFGISIQNSEREALRDNLTDLLKNHEKTLNPFQKINFQDSDALSGMRSQFRTFQPIRKKPKYLNASASKRIMDDKQLILDYSDNGFDQLIEVFQNPRNPLVNFAFGATEQMLRVLPPVKILAKA